MNAPATDFRLAVPRLAPGVLAMVVFAHGAILAMLWSWPRPVETPRPPEPLFVRLIETPAEAPATRPAPPTPVESSPPLAPPPPPPEPIARPLPLPRPAPAVAPAEPMRTEPPRLEAPRSEPVRAEPAPRPTEAVRPDAPRSEPVRPEPAAAPQAPAAPAPAPVTQPRFNADYLDNPKPPYPSLSRRMGEEGEVRLRVQVDAAGYAQQVELHRSSGFPRLDQAAIDTVRQWRFVPARQGDQPVPASVIVPIQFSLRS